LKTIRNNTFLYIYTKGGENMAVMGLPFIFNDVPSEFYGCSIVFIEEDPNKRTSGDGRTFTTIKPLRSAKQSVLDV
jgi:hypothetical protein